MSGPSGRTRHKKSRINLPSDPFADVLRRIYSKSDITKEELNRIYHLDTPVCHGCRINCKDNPNCLCGLIPSSNSSRKQGLWQKVSDTLEILGPDPSSELRPSKDSPSGLTNLGATCYVNSVLQCLYMTRPFREGLFAAETDLFNSEPILYQLGRLFAHLHSGKKLSVDSAAFANTLELDNAVQQDGQEFLKLLLTLLERVLARSKIATARNVVQDVFRGTFSYVTKCLQCGKESDVSNQLVDFYELELNVKGFANLDESLNDYLSEESLQGENQYLCEHCRSRVDAIHCTKLRSLPPVLNFQLKRFVFNAKTATKKKVVSKFSFPKVLDMRPRLTPPSSLSIPDNKASLYDISAILIHKGTAANSGHYVAHIKDDSTGEWWQFDDEEVTKLGARPLGEMPSSVNVVPSPKSQDHSTITMQPEMNGHQAAEECCMLSTGSELIQVETSCQPDDNLLMSADAYMLMYSRRESFEKTGCSSVLSTEMTMVQNLDSGEHHIEAIPEQFRAEVEELNESYDTMCHEYTLMKEEELTKIADRKAEVKQVLANASAKNSDSFCWISADWLKIWADSLKPLSPIDNSQLLCEHKKVSPKKVHLMKCISERAWVTLQGKYNGGPKLTGCDCCLTCILEDAKAAATADDYRSRRVAMRETLDNVLKGYGLEGRLFFVSKSWLMQWMRRKIVDAPSEADAGPTSSITCRHGGLLPEQYPGAKRQKVPEFVWHYLRENALQVKEPSLNELKPFPVDTEGCAECEAELTRVACKQEGLRATKYDQRQKHDSLYNGRSVVVMPKETYFLIPTQWVIEWRSYLGNSGKNVLHKDEPVGLDGSLLSLICKHERLLFMPPALTRNRKGEFVQKNMTDVFTIITTEDWILFCEEWYISEKGIRATLGIMEDEEKTMNGDADHNGSKSPPLQLLPVLQTDPEVCKECIHERENLELICKLQFQDKQITLNLVEGKEPPPYLLASNSVPDERRISKRARRTSGSNARRITLTVSGDTTIYQLKLLIWESLGVVKENQRVHFGRTELANESARLADLGILPGSQLWLLDTGVHENRDIAEELVQPETDGKNQVEEGFRGTRLLASTMPDISSNFSENERMDVAVNGHVDIVPSEGKDDVMEDDDALDPSCEVQQCCTVETTKELEDDPRKKGLDGSKPLGRHGPVT